MWFHVIRAYISTRVLVRSVDLFPEGEESNAFFLALIYLHK